MVVEDVCIDEAVTTRRQVQRHRLTCFWKELGKRGNFPSELRVKLDSTVASKFDGIFFDGYRKLNLLDHKPNPRVIRQIGSLGWDGDAILVGRFNSQGHYCTDV